MSKDKNIVYLIGSGLTNATAYRVGHGSEMVMRTLFDEIIKSLSSNRELATDVITGPLINSLIELSNSKNAPNIEELIDLLEASGKKACISMSQTLSFLFAKVLSEHVQKLIEDLPENLAEILLDLHTAEGNPEKLLGIITTNYDPLIEIALDSLGYDIDFGFEKIYSGKPKMTLLKLHGSINWIQSVPIGVKEPTYLASGDEFAWIGPRRFKEGSHYPFNMIWGKSRELLSKADIIRIIGCSLLPSDWHIAQLLFRTNILDVSNGKDKCIEIVNRFEDCLRIQVDYPMLKTFPMFEIDEVIRCVRFQEKSIEWQKEIDTNDILNAKEYLEKNHNPVEYWLQAKIQMLLNNNLSIKTSSGKLERFADNRS